MNLHKGKEIIVDFNAGYDLDLIDWFNGNKNFIGYGTVVEFDDSYVWIEDCPYAIQLEYVEIRD